MFGVGLRGSYGRMGLIGAASFSTATKTSFIQRAASNLSSISKNSHIFGAKTIVTRGGYFGAGSIRLASTKASANVSEGLTWNEFLALRLRRRRVNVICSVFTALTGVLIGWGFISNIEIDPTQMIFGFDPIMVYSFGLIVCGFAGYLVGPSVGDVVFKTLIRKQYASFLQKNTEFLHHIRVNRPDPSKQSYTNPVIDYYGEKIGSLKDYRRWLRDGRVYRKKLEKFF